MTRSAGSPERQPPAVWRAAFLWGAAVLSASLIAPPAGGAPRGLVPPRPLQTPDHTSQSLGESRAGLDSVGRPGPSCTPQLDVLTYHNGDLAANADVFLLFWGAEWQNDAEHISAAQQVITLYQEIGTSEYACAWREYALPHQPIGPSTYHGSEVIPTAPPSPLLDRTIQELIVAEVDAGGAPVPTDDTVYVVLPPRGVPVDLGGPGGVPGGPTGCGGDAFTFCGYHASFRRAFNDRARFRYAVLPFPCTAPEGTCFVDGAGDAGRSLQLVGSHELAEVVTDPDTGSDVGNGGWYSERTGFENADICESVGCKTDVLVGEQTLLVNSLWSNLAQGCVASVPCSPPPVECTDASPGACVPGRGAPGGCAFEWLVYPNLTLTAKGLPGARVTCADGQPFCDFDGAPDGQCTFQVAACLNSADPRVPCTPAAIKSAKLNSPQLTSHNATDSMNAQTILTALSSVDPRATGTVTGARISYSPAAATPNACTSFFKVVVPVRSSGLRARAGKRTIGPVLQTDAGRASNRLTLVCNPYFP